MSGYVILKKYRFCMWRDKLKAVGIAVFAWITVSLTIYGSIILLFIAAGIVDPRSPVDREAVAFVYLAVILMGGLFTLPFGLWLLRGMFDWIENWYIDWSADPRKESCSFVRIRGVPLWWTIFKWGYDRSDRILIFDGYEGNRYYRNDGYRRDWHYDDYKPPWYRQNVPQSWR